MVGHLVAQSADSLLPSFSWKEQHEQGIQNTSCNDLIPLSKENYAYLVFLNKYGLSLEKINITQALSFSYM